MCTAGRPPDTCWADRQRDGCSRGCLAALLSGLSTAGCQPGGSRSWSESPSDGAMLAAAELGLHKDGCVRLCGSQAGAARHRSARGLLWGLTQTGGWGCHYTWLSGADRQAPPHVVLSHLPAFAHASQSNTELICLHSATCFPLCCRQLLLSRLVGMRQLWCATLGPWAAATCTSRTSVCPMGVRT